MSNSSSLTGLWSVRHNRQGQTENGPLLLVADEGYAPLQVPFAEQLDTVGADAPPAPLLRTERAGEKLELHSFGHHARITHEKSYRTPLTQGGDAHGAAGRGRF